MSGLRSATARRPLLLLVAAISFAGLCAGSAVAASSPAAGGDGPLARTSSAGETCPNAAFRTGPAASLPDCRAYEMVSPVDKNGGDITTLCQNVCYRTSLIQSTLDGDKLTYSSYKSFGDQLGAFYSNQYLATRGAGGWSSKGLNPLHEGTIFAEFDPFYDLDIQVKAMSSDLSTAFLNDDAKPVLTPDASEGEANMYSRDSGTGAFTWITNLGSNFETRPEYEGISADGSHLVFAINKKLTPEAAATGTGNQIYDYSGGQLHLVSILPNATTFSGGAAVGTSAIQDDTGRERNVARAVSEDGSRIVWTAADGYASSGKIYERINNTETVEVSAVAAPGNATYQTASVDGKTVLFTIGATLYSVDVPAQTVTPIAGEVHGVVGASGDASYVYFVSTENLAAGATAGKPNLYLFHAGTYKLVGTISRVDIGEGSFVNNLAAEPSVSGYDIAGVNTVAHAARVSADGQTLAFQSIASLTGYDNRDVKNEEPDTEVYVYDAQAEQLICASCKAGGGRPDGRPLLEYDRADGHPANVNGKPGRRWTAAWLQTAESDLYLPRDLSEDGSRLFFNSFVGLVQGDNNNQQDVYEWEAPGTHGCEEAEGCVSLISTGESPLASEFADASASGDDVYFKTFSRLVPQDTGLLDIYDAREGGGFEAPPVPEAPCEGDACQTVPAPPNDPTPASSSYSGPANVVRKAHKKQRKHHHKKKHGAKHARHGRHATGRNG